MQTPKKEVHFSFFSVCCIVFNCSWQLIMFDKKQKSCLKRIHLAADDGLYNRKSFYAAFIFFVFTLVFLVYHDIIQRNNINLKTIKQIIYDWKNRKFRSFVNELTDTVCFLVLQNSKKNSYTKTVSGNDNFHGYYQWYNVDHKLNWNESIDVCRNELIWWP